MEPRLRTAGLLAMLMISACCRVEAKCSKSCLALVSYYFWSGANLSFVSEVLSAPVANIVSYNKDKISRPDSVKTGIRVNVPFSCGCIEDEFPDGRFNYSVRQGNTYDLVATLYYSNLTTAAWLQNFNNYPASNIPDNSVLNVVVNCSCGDSAVSKEYGL